MVLRRLAATAAAAALFGFALGYAHDLLYAVRNLVKFPLLIAVVGATCAASFWLGARLIGLDLDFVAAQHHALALARDLAFLLASLAPPVLCVAAILRATDDGALGEYDLFLGANVGLIAASGAIAWRRRLHAFAALRGATPARARIAAVCWLALALVVGGQAAFWMRPFFGFPATRGARPPFFLRDAPDRRGARNFFEACAQVLWRVPLPP